MTKRINVNDPDAIRVSVNGIPAIALIENIDPGDPGHPGVYSPDGLVDPGYPASPSQIEFTIWDRKGYDAPWLEAMADRRDIEEQIEAALAEEA